MENFSFLSKKNVNFRKEAHFRLQPTRFHPWNDDRDIAPNMRSKKCYRSIQYIKCLAIGQYLVLGSIEDEFSRKEFSRNRGDLLINKGTIVLDHEFESISFDEF